MEEKTKQEAVQAAPEAEKTVRRADMAEKTKQEAVQAAPEAEKTVKIRIPKDKEHKEPVWVRVNERKWLIQRGVEVEVPQCVYEVLKHQEEMEALILAFEEANATT